MDNKEFNQLNYIGFIKNEKAKRKGAIQKKLWLERNNENNLDTTMASNTSISFSPIYIITEPYFYLNSEREEWACYIRENFKKELLDSLLNEKITFDIEWNDEGKVINFRYVKEPQNKKVKVEFERAIYSTPNWIVSKRDGKPMDSYELTFDNSNIYNCLEQAVLHKRG